MLLPSFHLVGDESCTGHEDLRLTSSRRSLRRILPVIVIGQIVAEFDLTRVFMRGQASFNEGLNVGMERLGRPSFPHVGRCTP